MIMRDIIKGFLLSTFPLFSFAQELKLERLSDYLAKNHPQKEVLLKIEDSLKTTTGYNPNTRLMEFMSKIEHSPLGTTDLADNIYIQFQNAGLGLESDQNLRDAIEMAIGRYRHKKELMAKAKKEEGLAGAAIGEPPPSPSPPPLGGHTSN
jgi:hypothetical protein